MNNITLYLLFLLTFNLQSQDKLFFLDGSTKTGKVTEIGPEQIIVKINNENTAFQKSLVLLIEFKNGASEIINVPTENITNVVDKKENFHFKQSTKEIYNYNQVSINSLALCNADISIFYERILPIKKLGLGVMGAYNFNLYANNLNSSIAILNNSKKKYDLGAFANFYPTRFEKRTRMYLGVLLKYTAFDYTSVKEDSVKVGNAYSSTTIYTAAKGSQLSTIFTIGSHANITKNFFIKTIFGIGAFKLNGDYKSQYNIEINKQNTQSNKNSNGPPQTYNYLPKIYVGINLGFKL